MTMQPGGLYGGPKGQAWPAVVAVLVFLILAGLDTGNYPGAHSALTAFGILVGVLRWVTFIAFIIWVFWGESK